MFVITDAQSIKGVNVGSKLTTGSIHQSASVAEMAGDMGVPASVLQKELDEYNACARKGAPDRFGRTVYAQTIEKPPFYWGRERLMVHTTLGGLHVDAKARVLREDGSFIEGLYAAGEAAGGIWGADRPGGAGLLQCLVMGRIAGQSAAQQIKRLLQTGSG